MRRWTWGREWMIRLEREAGEGGGQVKQGSGESGESGGL